MRRHPASLLWFGAAIQLLTGVPAAWGAFQPSVMAAYAFTEQQAGSLFYLTIAAFGVGCVVGGFVQDKRGPRPAALGGTALLTAGFALTGFLPPGAFVLFALTFSLPVGLGSAILYPAVMGCAQKWYPGRKGLATGIVGLGLGASGAFLGWLARFVGGQWGIRVCFWVLAGLILPVCGGASLLLHNPPSPKPLPCQQGRRPPPLDVSPAAMLRTRQYWLGFGAVACATPSVLLFSPILLRLVQERGLPESAGVWCIALGSVGSAGGRVLLPLLSDHWGRRRVYLLVFGAMAGLSAAFWPAQSWWVVGLYALLTFCYSGQAALLPALATDLFGLPHTGQNYGLLALGMTAGSLGFPLLAQALGLQTGRHWVAIGSCILGFLCMLGLRVPPQPVTQKQQKR